MLGKKVWHGLQPTIARYRKLAKILAKYGIWGHDSTRSMRTHVTLFIDLAWISTDLDRNTHFSEPCQVCISTMEQINSLWILCRCQKCVLTRSSANAKFMAVRLSTGGYVAEQRVSTDIETCDRYFSLLKTVHVDNRGKSTNKMVLPVFRWPASRTWREPSPPFSPNLNATMEEPNGRSIRKPSRCKRTMRITWKFRPNNGARSTMIENDREASIAFPQPRRRWSYDKR